MKKTILGGRFIMRYNKFDKIITIMLIVTFLLGFSVYTFANDPKIEKEETAYIILNYDGSLDSVYMVNTFEYAAGSRVYDYGRYEYIRQLDGDFQYKAEDERILLDIYSGTISYEAKLKNGVIPWVINITYMMNGVEYTAEEIAGMKGHLEIRIKVTVNANGNSIYFDRYALQISLSPDRSIFTNITAPGATTANAGKQKQITYTILPGQEKEIFITADVIDFEMPGITIVGVPMNMSMDFDFANININADFSMLKQGVLELDDGAKELNKGIISTSDGIYAVKEGTEALSDGLSYIKDGAHALNEGAQGLYSGLEQLDTGFSDITSGFSELLNGSNNLYGGMVEIEAVIENISKGASDLSVGTNMLTDGTQKAQAAANELYKGADGLVTGMENFDMALNNITAQNDGLIKMAYILFEDTLASLNSQIGDFSNYNISVSTELIELNRLLTNRLKIITPQFVETDPVYKGLSMLIFYKSVVSYAQGVEQLAQGSTGILQGAEQLKTGVGQLGGGISELKDATVSLNNGANAISSGSGELLAGVKNMTEGIKNVSYGITEVDKNMTGIKNALSQAASGTLSLKKGSYNLSTGITELYDVSVQLANGLDEVHTGFLSIKEGTGALSAGLTELKEGTDNIEDDIFKGFKQYLNVFTGKDMFTPVSFVSDKNTNISSVQFIMQTPDIRKPESVKKINEEETEQTFWFRFTSLFKRKK